MASGDTLAITMAREFKRPAGWQVLQYTSGGTTAIVAGDTITGATSGATATVVVVRVRSGSWAVGDAAGYFIIKDLAGVFQAAEDLDVGASTNLASIPGPAVENAAASAFVAASLSTALSESSQEFVLVDAILSGAYASGGGSLRVNHSMSAANTSKSAVLDAFVMPVGDGADLTSFAFDDDGSEDSVTEAVPAAADEFGSAVIAIADAQMPAAGERFRLLLVRDVGAAADDAAGALRVDSLRLSET